MRRVLLLILLALLTAPPGRAGESSGELFAAATLPLHAGPGADAGLLGKLPVAARLVPLETAPNGWREVRVSGWTQAGAERAVQAVAGIRVLRAALGKAGVAALHFGETRTDPDTGLDWTRTSLTGWIAPDAATVPDLDTLWARAEPLFATRCTACHERRIPARYSAGQWTSHLKVMGPRTGLPEDDQALIRTFLQYRSSDATALAEALAEE